MVDDVLARVLVGIVAAGFFGLQGWTLKKVTELGERVARVEAMLAQPKAP